MRIALVTETYLPRVDGIVRMLIEFLDYLQTRGHSAILFAPGDGPTQYGNVEVVRVRGVGFPLYPGLVVAPHSRRMRPILRAWQPDIVHLAGPFVLGAYGLRLARDLGFPVASHYQTDLVRFARHYGLSLFAGLTWRRLLAIHNDSSINFAPTETIAAELRGDGMRNVHVLGRGVDTQMFHPGRRDPALRATITGAQDRPVLAYVGRVAPEKGLSTLIAVAKALPDAALLVVGDGHTVRRLPRPSPIVTCILPAGCMAKNLQPPMLQQISLCSHPSSKPSDRWCARLWPPDCLRWECARVELKISYSLG